MKWLFNKATATHMRSIKVISSSCINRSVLFKVLVRVELDLIAFEIVWRMESPDQYRMRLTFSQSSASSSGKVKLSSSPWKLSPKFSTFMMTDMVSKILIEAVDDGSNQISIAVELKWSYDLIDLSDLTANHEDPVKVSVIVQRSTWTARGFNISVQTSCEVPDKISEVSTTAWHHVHTKISLITGDDIIQIFLVMHYYSLSIILLAKSGYNFTRRNSRPGRL